MTTRPDRRDSGKSVDSMLLHSRMEVLGLDVGAWAHVEPVIIEDLRTACTGCTSPGRCADDLVAHFDDPDWPDWRDYCPNAAKLNMLIALQFSLILAEPLR